MSLFDEAAWTGRAVNADPNPANRANRANSANAANAANAGRTLTGLLDR
jgi:hypothetical protein